MTKDHLETILDDFYQKRKEIRTKKGQDYANEDTLSNFKLAGNIIGLKPEMQILSLIATKVARLGNLIGEDKKVNNESVEDSVLDLTNYCELLYAVMMEDVSETIIYGTDSGANAGILTDEAPSYGNEHSALSYKVGDEFTATGTSEKHTITEISQSTICYNLKGSKNNYPLSKIWFEDRLRDGFLKITHRFIEPEVFP